MQRPEPPAVRSEINVTPLVDVVLVLLIIFMVVTPMLRDEASIQPPVTDDPPVVDDQPDLLAVSLAADGTIRIGGESVAPDRLEAKLQSSMSRGRDHDILIKADSGLSFGTVQGLMTAVRRAGFNNVGLIADQREGI